MEERILVTGTIFNRVIRVFLLVIFAVIIGGVIYEFTVTKVQPTKETKQIEYQGISKISPDMIAEGNYDNQQYLVLSRVSGEYAFAKVQNATIDNDKFIGVSEFILQNGDAKLVSEVNGSIGLYDNKSKVLEMDKIVMRGVMGLNLTDGTILPVKIVSGRISQGKLVGDVELWSLRDNSRILGTFDTRGNFLNVSSKSSLQEADTALVAVGKEVLNWLEKSKDQVTVKLPGATPTPKTLAISGAITVDPRTGLAIINSGAVGDAQIANKSITNLKIADGAITTIKIADGAVTSGKIADGTFTESKIADGAVTTAKIADGAITNAKLGDFSIANSKLATITDADKVAGEAVQLKSGGGLAHGSGLTLRTDCSTDQVLRWDGDSWECVNVGGVGAGVSSLNLLTGGLSIAGGGINSVSAAGSTITVTGTLPNVGTSGTYGSATNIPVFTTDANGRVSGVTNTAISGLTSANLAASAGITNGQLSNSSIFVSPGSGMSVSGSPVSLGGTVTIAGVDASTTVKGVASFNSTNFSVVSGAVNTIQPIDTTATPTFNSLTLTKVNNQLVLGTTNTTTISSTAPSASRVATIPALSASDEFVFKNQNQTLSSKTIDAGSNTISGLTNSNLSGTAGITDANLATITTTNKVSGSAVQLNANGGITNSTGLSLLTSCASGEILKWNGSAWACAADVSGGSPALNTITAALAANSINNGDSAQVWNWAMTTAAKTAFTFGENTASINGAGSQYVLGASTLAGSTAAPLVVSARGNKILDTTSTGGLTFGNTSANTPITINSGTGAINIGTDVAAKNIAIGNGTDDTFSLNSSAFTVSTSGALSGISTINASGQITSTVATGTAPFSIASTTNVANLNASFLNGATFTAPGTIGGGTPGIGNFTTVNGQSINLSNTTNQLVLGTTNTTTISSTAPSANRVATIPALSASDEFVFLNQSQILTNKTIAAGSNTISGLTNSNLSGTAGITDANLATITTANKVSGSAVQLNANGGITNSTGLSLLTSCASGEILKWNGSAWACSTDNSGGSPTLDTNSGLQTTSGLSLLRSCADNQILKWTASGGWACAADDSGSGTSALSSITSATGTNTIANGDNAQTWNWALTTAAKTAFNFGETSAATNGAGSQYILGVSTLASSTAGPFKVAARGNTIIDTSTIGGLTFGNTTANTPITINSGTGTIAIGTDVAAKTITIGNAADDTFSLNSSGLNVTSGGALTGVASIDTITTSATGFTFAGAGSITTTTSSNLTLDSGTTGSVLIGTGVAAKTITIGNAADDTFSINSSAFNVSSTGAVSGVSTLGLSGAITGATATNTINGMIINGSTQTFSANNISDSGSLTIKSASGSNNLTLDSGSTGSVLIGTGVAAKTITIGNAADDSFSINSSGLNVSTGGALTGVASVDTIAFGASSIAFAGAGSVTSNTTNSLTLDSGSTGSVLIGTGVAAKTITIGNAADDTFSINSSGLNVSTAGALTGVTSITAQTGNFTNTTNQLVLGTTNTTTISSTAPSANRIATIPALSASDTFVFLNQSGTLTNKTLDSASNTISNLTNSNLSGTAGITDANLATITTANKVSGSAVQLNANGGITNSTGLTLLTTCGTNEILKWSGSAWACATDNSGGSPALSTIAAAAGANTIANGDNAQTWNWALTTAAKTAFTFGESAASTNGAGSQYILNARTAAASTAAPLGVFARTFPIIDTTAAGGVTIGNATLAQGITIDSGVGAISIGNSATGKTITIGSATGTGATNIYAGTGNFILDGAGATTYSFGTSTTNGTFTVGGSAQTGTANLFTGTGGMALNIGTGAGANTIILGNTNTTTGTTINSGTNGITLLTGTSGNVSIKSGTTGTVTLDSGTTGAVNIGTGANAKTVTLGSSDTTSTTNINSGTGGIALLTGTTGNLSLTTGTTGTATLDSGTTGDVNVGTGITGAGKNVFVGNTNGTSSLTLAAGTGGINIANAAVANTVNISTGAAAKTLTMGSTDTTSTTNIQAGSGQIHLLSNATASANFTIGGQLQVGRFTADPSSAGVGSIYYNTTTNKFRCFENAAWINCTGSNTQQTSSSFAAVTMTPVNTDVLLGTVSITPTTAQGSVYVYANLFTNSLNNTNQTITASIHSGTTCAGTTLASGASTLTNANGTDGPSVFVATLVSHPGASAQNYAICSQSTTNNGASAGGLGVAMVIDTGADYAELYSSHDYTLQPGDLVSFDASLKAGIKKSVSAYDKSVLGIVSTKPGMLIGNNEDGSTNMFPVALSGRVPVKVTSANGAIRAGDYLTSSSIPGVAMRATKAGSIIGTAMSGFDGEGVGIVTAFVKGGESNGSKLADVMNGIDLSGSTYNAQILAKLISEKDQVTPESVDISEILTDRVVAGVEIITPKVTTQDILATGLFVMIDKDGRENVKISSTGDATLSGTLVVDTIKARRIEGMEMITRKLSLLSEEVAGVATNAAQVTYEPKVTETNILDLISKAIAQIYTNTAEFIGRVIFKGDVNFVGRPTFNKDTAGFATIKSGGSEVEVTFAREYASEPVVTATVQIAGGAAVADIPSYAVADVNTKGFKIRISRSTGMDIRFAWVAIAVSEKTKFEGNGGVVATPTPTPSVTINLPEPTPTIKPTIDTAPTPTETVTPTQNPTPTPTIAETVTPTPAPTTNISQTENASESGSL